MGGQKKKFSFGEVNLAGIENVERIKKELIHNWPIIAK